VGLDPGSLDTTLTDVLIDPSSGIAPAVHATRYENLSVLAAHESLGTLESELAAMPDRESLLSAAWSDDLPFRVAVFDVPPALSLYTVNALKLADAVVIPVQTHPFAMASVPRTLDFVDRVRRHLNPRLTVLGYLATLYDRRTRVARECLAKMIDQWGELLIEAPIPTNVALAEAARDGRLLYEADPDSAGAAAYYAAAAEIVARWRAARNGRSR
jgi:chromosome partitioning protein